MPYKNKSGLFNLEVQYQNILKLPLWFYLGILSEQKFPDNILSALNAGRIGMIFPASEDKDAADLLRNDQQWRREKVSSFKHRPTQFAKCGQEFRRNVE